ncbi:MAG TPA: aldehyde dehydrogenase family protein, partial [Rhodopila sp.]
ELGGKSANILLPEVDAIRLANETVYGLAAYVQSSDLQHARRVAAEMRAGNVFANYPAWIPPHRSAATSSPAMGAKIASGQSMTLPKSKR